MKKKGFFYTWWQAHSLGPTRALLIGYLFMRLRQLYANKESFLHRKIAPGVLKVLVSWYFLLPVSIVGLVVSFRSASY